MSWLTWYLKRITWYRFYQDGEVAPTPPLSHTCGARVRPRAARATRCRACRATPLVSRVDAHEPHAESLESMRSCLSPARQASWRREPRDLRASCPRVSRAIISCSSRPSSSVAAPAAPKQPREDTHEAGRGGGPKWLRLRQP
jgi:hypothetical protein